MILFVPWVEPHDLKKSLKILFCDQAGTFQSLLSHLSCINPRSYHSDEIYSRKFQEQIRKPWKNAMAVVSSGTTFVF